MNATFDLNHDLATYDTLEMFHEHACSERRDRYQTSSGGYAGCHEWDYEGTSAFVIVITRPNVVQNLRGGSPLWPRRTLANGPLTLPVHAR